MLSKPSACASCPFRDTGIGFVPPSGDPASKVWFLGEAPGEDEVSEGEPFCLDADTPILMANLVWTRLGDVQVGDRIIGVDEHSPRGQGISGHVGRKIQIATVLNKHVEISETLTIVSDKGALCGTPDHRVLSRAAARYGNDGWLRLDQLQSPTHSNGRGSKIAMLVRPWEVQTSYQAGWLAGFFDGEGWVAGSHGGIGRAARAYVGFSQNEGEALDKVRLLLAQEGFQLRGSESTTFKGKTCHRQVIAGGITESMRFLGAIRPVRLLRDFDAVLSRTRITNRLTPRAHIKGRFWSGKKEVVDITTSTGTFIANGFVVHNCGPSGEELWSAAGHAGIEREGVYVANTIQCRPPRNDYKLVPRAAVEFCQRAHVATPSDGTTVFLVGGKALEAMWPGIGGIERWRGSVLRKESK